MDNYTITELREKLLSKELSSFEITKYYLERIKKHDEELNTYITVCEEEALKQARDFDNKFELMKSKKISGMSFLQRESLHHVPHIF